MSDAWIIEENIKRFRAMLAKPCDDTRRKTLIYLLEREEEKFRNFRLPQGGKVIPVDFPRRPSRRARAKVARVSKGKI